MRTSVTGAPTMRVASAATCRNVATACSPDRASPAAAAVRSGVGTNPSGVVAAVRHAACPTSIPVVCTALDNTGPPWSNVSGRHPPSGQATTARVLSAP